MRWSLGLSLVLLAAPSAELEEGVGLSPKLGAVVPVLASDRPVVLLPMVFGCGTQCPTLLEGTAAAVSKLTRPVNVALASFAEDESERDGAEAVRRFANARVLVGAAAAEVLRATGFSWRHEPLLNQEVHPVGLVVLTSAGKVSAYLPGVWPTAEVLEQAVAAAETGTEVAWREGPALNCFRFDPAARRVEGVLRWWLPLLVVVTVGVLGATVALTRRRRSADV